MLRPVGLKRTSLSRAVSFGLGLFASLPASANPEGMQVMAGTATLAVPNAQTLEITNSPGAILNWQGFDIGAGEVTRFIQQDAASAVLNRVVTQNPSEIMGQLVSNGRVFLINPSGILIGRDGMVDTAGLVMSTLDIRDADFTAGRYTFEGGAGSGAITNHGYIKTAPNGEIILIAPKILNAPEGTPGATAEAAAGEANPSGLIEAEGGDLILAAGYKVTLSSLDDPDITFEVQAPDNEVVNLGQLLAKGGTASVLAGTIRHSGEVNADSLTVDAHGRIRLVASTRVATTAESVTSARGDEGLGGGEILIEGAQTVVAGTVDASGDTTAGTVHVLGDKVELKGAVISANSATGGGGNVRVGGEFQGGDGLRAAETTTVDDQSRLEANAGTAGDGGTVIVWSDVETEFNGLASARGGSAAGDGGLVEVSGKETLRYAGSADVGAPSGAPGTLLLDPTRIFLIPGGATVSVSDEGANAGDLLGGSFTSVQTLPNGNLLVINQVANVGSFSAAGKVLLFDSFGNQLGSLSGNATNQRLGSFFGNTIGGFQTAGGNRMFVSPNASSPTNLTNAGALILFDLTNGVEIGRTSGISQDELFGNFSTIDQLAGNFIVGSFNADVNGISNAGSVVTVSGTTGLELGRISGTGVNEQLGLSVVPNDSTNTFRIQAPNALGGAGTVIVGSAVTGAKLGSITGVSPNDQVGADVEDLDSNVFRIVSTSFGANDEGAVIVGSMVTGGQLGRIDGVTSGDFAGITITDNFELGRYRIDAPNFGPNDEGAVITGELLTGAERGRISGAEPNDRFGERVETFNAAPNTFRIVALGADNGAIPDAGAVIIGDSLEGHRRGITMGQSDFENYGSEIYFAEFGQAPTGTFIVVSRTADLGGTGNDFDDAGTVVLVDSATGAEIGRADGFAANDNYGSLGPVLSGSGNYFIRDLNRNGGQGALDLISGSVGAGGGTRLASVNGNATGEGLSLNLIQLSANDWAVLSPGHTNGRQDTNAGAVFVVSDQDIDGVTPGVQIERGTTEGVSQDERFGSAGVAALLSSGFLITSEDASTPGFTRNGSVVLIGYDGNEIGRVDGTRDNEALGARGVIVAPNENYWIPSPLWEPNSTTPDLGSVILADGVLGTELGRVDATLFGTNNNQQFGSDFVTNLLGNGDLLVRSVGPNTGGGVIAQLAATDLDGQAPGVQFLRAEVAGVGPVGLTGAVIEFAPFQSLGLFSHYAVRAAGDGLNSEGSVSLVDGTNGTVVTLVGALPSEGLGSRPLVVVPGGNLAVPNPGANGGDGEIRFIDPFNGFANSGLELGSSAGLGQAREGFGDANTVFNLSSFAFVGSFDLFAIHTPRRDVSGKIDAGEILLMSGTPGNVTVLGAISGREHNDRLGANGSSDIQRLFTAGNANKFLVFDADADNPGGAPGDGNNEGAIILADFTGAELGRFYGQTDNEGLGNISSQNSFVLERGNGNLFAVSRLAGANDEGTLYLRSGADLSRIGEVSGTLPNERFSRLLNTTALTNGDVLVSGNFVPGGALVQVADFDLGNNRIERGRITAGPNEFINPFAVQMEPFGQNYVVTSLNADPGGNTDAGTAYFVQMGTGTLLRQINGLSPGDNFGSFHVSPNNTLIFNNVLADVGGVQDAGRYVVADSAGNILGDLRGNTLNERLGLVQTVVGTERWIVAALHNQGAGGIFAVADQDLGTQNIVKASLLGAIGSGDPDGVGSRFPAQFPGMAANTRFVTVPGADSNGLVDNGATLLVDSLLNVIGRTNGTSSGERYGADDFVQLSNNGLALESPDADAGGFTKAGTIVQIDPLTGLEIQRVSGISPNERLGAFGRTTLSGGRTAFHSPNADMDGVLDAGRFVFFDPSAAIAGKAATNLLFGNRPSGDFVVTSGAIELALNAGANLVLQAHQDIVIQKGFALSATGGSLTLQAGRSIIVNGLLNLPETNLTLIANESQAAGVDLSLRGSGRGEFLLEDPQVVGKTIDLKAEAVRLFGSNDSPDAVNILQTSSELFENFLQTGELPGPAAFVFGIKRLNVRADLIELIGGSSPGAFAAFVSGGKFTVDAGSILLEPGTSDGAHALFVGLGGHGEFSFDRCSGCGDTPLFTDPFLDGEPTSGIFIAGQLQELTTGQLREPSVNAILALLDRAADSGAGGDQDEDDAEDEETKETKECAI